MLVALGRRASLIALVMLSPKAVAVVALQTKLVGVGGLERGGGGAACTGACMTTAMAIAAKITNCARMVLELGSESTKDDN